MGLEMGQTYYYKVKVSNGSESGISSTYSSERTWCKAGSCEGISYNDVECPICLGDKTITCSKCSGGGKILCTSCKGAGGTFCKRYL